MAAPRLPQRARRGPSQERRDQAYLKPSPADFRTPATPSGLILTPSRSHSVREGPQRLSLWLRSQRGRRCASEGRQPTPSRRRSIGGAIRFVCVWNSSHLAHSPFAFKRAFAIAMSARTISHSTLSIGSLHEPDRTPNADHCSCGVLTPRPKHSVSIDPERASWAQTSASCGTRSPSSPRRNPKGTFAPR